MSQELLSFGSLECQNLLPGFQFRSASAAPYKLPWDIFCPYKAAVFCSVEAILFHTL